MIVFRYVFAAIGAGIFATMAIRGEFPVLGVTAAIGCGGPWVAAAAGSFVAALRGNGR